MSIIINNIIIANEQGGSQIEQWPEKISNRCNIEQCKVPFMT